ncbi:hypothetical protein Droror1_Dr00020636 [Drosera rotundifolia]
MVVAQVCFRWRQAGHRHPGGDGCGWWFECRVFVESRDHVFLECEYVKEVWNIMLRKLQLRCHPPVWNLLSKWLCRVKQGTSERVEFRKAALMAVVYYMDGKV